MSVISEEMNILNADGVDFVSLGFHLENGEPIGEIYESYSKGEFIKSTCYPRSNRVYWYGSKDDKKYICENINFFGFDEALKNLLKGKKLSRKGWNGLNQYIYYVPKGQYAPCTEVATEIINEYGKVEYGAYIAFKTKSNVVPWVASQTDLLEKDWRVV